MRSRFSTKSLEQGVSKAIVRLTCGCLFLGLLFLTAGCGKKTPHSTEHVKVSGKVLFKDKPLPGGRVTFVAVNGGFSASGPIDEKGHYEIQAPVGEVVIGVDNKMLAPKRGKPKEIAHPKRPDAGEEKPITGKYVIIPPKYSDPQTSGLTYTVTAGAQNHDITLADVAAEPPGAPICDPSRDRPEWSNDLFSVTVAALFYPLRTPTKRGLAMLAPPSTSERPASTGWWRRLTGRLTPTIRRRWWLFLVLLVLAAGAVAAARPRLQAWYHWRAARAEIQRYHNPQAIRHLQVCMKAWPNDPDVLLLSARSARRARVYADTIRLLRMYQQARGRDAAADFEQLLLSAECRVDQVSELCWSYVEKDHPDTPLLLEALTRGYLRQYRVGQARFCLDRWLQLQPDNPQAYFLEGLLLFDYLHSRPAAIDSYRRAVALDADHEEARLGLAVALLGNKNYAEAAPNFERLRQCQPDSASVQVGLAECLDGLGQRDQAERLVNEVLAQQPNFGPALSLRGQFLLEEGQLAEAERCLRQALRRKPTDHRGRYSLIRCLEQSGQEEEARRQRQQFQRMEEDMARFNDIVSKEIAQRPTDPALHCTLGQILMRGGQRDEGLRWIQSALKLDPHYAPARQALADSLGKGRP